MFELYRQNCYKLWPKGHSSILKVETEFSLGKFINIADCVRFRRWENGSSGGCQKVSWSRRERGGGGKKRLQFGKLCSQDEQHCDGGARHSEAPEETPPLSETSQVKKQESLSSPGWTETSYWCLKGRNILFQEEKNFLWVINVDRFVWNKTAIIPVMLFWLIEGLKKIQTMFGVAVTEEDTEEEGEEVEANPMRQLQDLCAPHRHRPSSLEALVRETGSVWSMMQTSSEVLRNTLTVSLGTS